MTQHLFKRVNGSFTSYEFDELRGTIIPHGAMTDAEIQEALGLHLSAKQKDQSLVFGEKLDRVIVVLESLQQLLGSLIAAIEAEQKSAPVTDVTDEPAADAG